DLVVHVPTLLDGVVLTHRLTDPERARGWIEAGADLAVLCHYSNGLRLAEGGEVELRMLFDGEEVLVGPEGWLEHFEPGTLLGFGVEGDTLSLQSVPEPGAPESHLVDAARAAYDREVDEPWLPVGADEIVVGMLHDRPGILAIPTAPASEFLAAAGLEQRGVEFAHEESVWREARKAARAGSLFDGLPDQDRRRQAARVLDVLDASEPEPGALHEALTALRDHRILSAITDQVLDLDDDEDQLDEVATFAEALLGAARRPRETAPAQWLLSVVSERRCDPLTGQTQLELALEADPGFLPAVDRLAWYLSDRGDALGALRLWRRLGVPEEHNQDLREVTQFAEPAPSGLGRNEPCWCGSGRKFKHCHLGQPAAFALPERVGWLCRKAVAYLERRGGEAPEDVYELAVARAGGDDSEEALDRAFADPIVLDVALHEGGWFDRFIEERGALLPGDEAMLARAWTLVDRTLYEVVGTDPGRSMSVRDLRSAEVVQARERTFSRQAHVGQVFCGRAVPDGETNQFVGGIFHVPTGQEKHLLDMLDEGDGHDLLAWLAARERPPQMTTREGEDMRVCRVVLEVPNPEVVRGVLDRLYDPHGADQWTEHHELASGESILRATIELEGNLVRVETLSEPRVERVLETLLSEIAGAMVLSDERREFDPMDPPRGPRQPAMSLDDPGAREAFQRFIADRERSWCDETVPALGGLTPRQAAADPAGREGLERLLLEYGSHVDPQDDPELVPQHPDRLRRLLGIG
ncbi:MAG: SEC-C domain-containing protein, partial [Acidimicrobiales bacterium]